MWLGIDVLSELNHPVPPLECTCQTSWLPLTTERSRVTCAFMFSQNKNTSCVSVGRASFSVLCQPSYLNTLSTLFVTAVKVDKADSGSLKPTIHGTQGKKNSQTTVCEFLHNFRFECFGLSGFRRYIGH